MINPFLVFNWLAMIGVLLILMAVVIHDRHLIGVSWISLVFFLLLLSIFLRRVDDLGALFGVDIFSSDVSLLLSWCVIGTLAYGKWKVHQNARNIRELQETKLDLITDLEKMRAHDEQGVGYSWDHITHISR